MENERMRQVMSVKQAKEVAKQKGISLSSPTIRKYAIQKRLGYRIGHKYFIDKEKFRRFINGQNDS